MTLNHNTFIIYKMKLLGGKLSDCHITLQYNNPPLAVDL